MQSKIKSLVLVVVGFIAVITAISLLMPSSVTNAESVMVHAGKEKIAHAIGDLNNWKYWHPVFMREQSMQVISPAEARWTSDGRENTMKILSADSSFFTIEISRQGLQPVLNYISIDPITNQEGLQVSWRVVTPLKWYPWEKFGGMMLGKIAGQGYQEALVSLKKFIEK